ncbi:hypothetical protein EIN_149480 [Entamoeba invadens IP1]|uniref:Stealth protein CR2 conserved region 2 domain-containing protein n=1 Tax=Entamoeba invadens IP1 TaxID=370355 RepID=L7FKL5_ENTIV|nr:hypothetical protein EIN_149480 [Entamoeba invadens IP1]ELP85546.1 hypothetical protein EIN_149480 [Entamoeba invadens IP1]|eukprot:XP_004184892.1 hypothetical protein EIN_149480 [Entamoeba invadens IP1]
MQLYVLFISLSSFALLLLMVLTFTIQPNTNFPKKSYLVYTQFLNDKQEKLIYSKEDVLLHNNEYNKQHPKPIANTTKNNKNEYYKDLRMDTEGIEDFKEDNTHLYRNLFKIFRFTKPRKSVPVDFTDSLKSLPDECGGHLDALWLWVNGSEEKWVESVKKYKPDYDSARFRDYNTLLYSMRSVYKYAPYIKRYFLATADQVPSYLNAPLGETSFILKSHNTNQSKYSHAKQHKESVEDVYNNHRDKDLYTLELVSHSEFVNNKSLPLFNSDALESRIHHIKNLGNCFVYFNDDFLLARPTPISYFFKYGKVHRYCSIDYDAQKYAHVSQHQNSTSVANQLINKRFGLSKDTQHYFQSHVEYTLLKTSLLELEMAFPVEFEKQQNLKFREFGAINMQHIALHYMRYTGKAFQTFEMEWNYFFDFKINHNKNHESLFKINETEPYSVCINDALNGYDNDPEAGDKEIRYVLRFLQRMLPEKTPFELDFKSK